MTSTSNHPVPVLQMENVFIPDRENPESWRLENVNLTMNAGDYLVIGGPPGSGKSALLNTAACLMRPAKGKVRLFGKEIEEMVNTEKDRARVGFVFEEGTRLFHHMTVEENIALPVRYHLNLSAVEAYDFVKPWIKRFDLDSVAFKHPGNLARPVRARVALARALVMKPEFLLLDNPLSGLDFRQGQWLLDLLTSLSQGKEPGFESPMTLLVAADNLVPWKKRTRHFGVLNETAFYEADHPEFPEKPKRMLNELFGDI